MGHGHDAEGVVATAVRAEPLIELLRAVTARSGDLEELALRYPASLVAREQDRLACIRARIRERAAELLHSGEDLEAGNAANWFRNIPTLSTRPGLALAPLPTRATAATYLMQHQIQPWP